jgi:hypothetical protein
MGTDVQCTNGTVKAPLCATHYSITFVGPMSLPNVGATWIWEGGVNHREHYNLASRSIAATTDMQRIYRMQTCATSSVCNIDKQQEPVWLTMDAGVDQYASWSVTSQLHITDFPFSKCQENQVRASLALAHSVDANQVAISDLSQTAVNTQSNSTGLSLEYTVRSFALMPEVQEVLVSGSGTLFVNSSTQAAVKTSVQTGDKYVKAEGSRIEQEMSRYKGKPKELLKNFYAILPTSLRLDNGPSAKVNFSDISEGMGMQGPVYNSEYNKAATEKVMVPTGLNYSSFTPLLQVCGSAEIVPADSKWARRIVSQKGQEALLGAWAAFLGVPNSTVMIEKISTLPEHSETVTARRLAETTSALAPILIHFAASADSVADAQRMRERIVATSHQPNMAAYKDNIPDDLGDDLLKNVELVLKYAKPLEDATTVRTIVPALYELPVPASAVKPPALALGGGHPQKASSETGPSKWLLIGLPVALVACLVFALGALLVLRSRSHRGTKTRGVSGGDFPKGKYHELDMESHPNSSGGDFKGWAPGSEERSLPQQTYDQPMMHEMPPTTGHALWRYVPQNQASVGIRALPDIEGAMTQYLMQPGEMFEVSEEQPGPAGITFLRLADGRGWLFDRKPGIGVMCMRANQPTHGAVEPAPQGAREMRSASPRYPDHHEAAAGFPPSNTEPNTRAAARLREVMPPPPQLQVPGPAPGFAGTPGPGNFDRAASHVTGVSSIGVPPGSLLAAGGAPHLLRPTSPVPGTPLVPMASEHAFQQGYLVR